MAMQNELAEILLCNGLTLVRSWCVQLEDDVTGAKQSHLTALSPLHSASSLIVESAYRSVLDLICSLLNVAEVMLRQIRSLLGWYQHDYLAYPVHQILHMDARGLHLSYTRNTRPNS